MIDPPPQERKNILKQTVTLWREYMRPYRLSLLCAVIGGIISAASGGFGLPVILQKMFPVIFGGESLNPYAERFLLQFVSREELPNATVWFTVALLPTVVVVKGIFSFVNVYFLSRIGLGILETLRLKIYRRYQELSLSFHDRFQRGDLLSRLMQDTQFLQTGLVQIANDLMIQPMTLVSALGFLIYKATVSEQFLILLTNMLLVGACIIPIRYIGKRMLRKSREALASQGNLASVLQENLASQRDVRSFELEGRQISLFREKIQRFIRASISVVRWQSFLTPLIEFVSALAMAATLFVAHLNGMTMGDFAALATAMYLCYEPIKKLGAVSNKAETLTAALERLNVVLEAEDEVPDPEHPVKLKEWRGEIDFRDVSFAYKDGHPVMRDVRVHVPTGQVVALVGPSGAGKTTFINLLCRFYDVSSGCVCIDGVDVRSLCKKDLMEHIALVSQFPVLFRGTIADNIRIGNPQADDAALREAGRMAAVDRFVDESPEGYDRPIGEMGEGLSGGQRQRVSLARAFLKNAPILILDEATASLDMKSEAMIQQEIDRLAAGRTTFIIAHRFSTIRMADRILVLEGGRIVGDGTHRELMESSELYRDLYRKQQATEGDESC